MADFKNLNFSFSVFYNFFCIVVIKIILKNWPTSASFSFIFGLFKQTIHFYNKSMQKNVHPVYSDRI